jgi:hypothetical protein
MSSGTLCRVALFRTNVSGNVLSPSSGVHGLIGFHSCITVETLTDHLHRGTLLQIKLLQL